jgi:SAM-dependent methyltransferase
MHPCSWSSVPVNFASYYDAVINWQARLAREMPLLVDTARRAGGRILVPACGTGGHVVALAQQGFDVLGFDADADMVEFTRQRIQAATDAIAATQGKAEVRLLTMEGAVELPAEFTAAFCLGNPLPGLSAEGQLLNALRGVTSALRPGGIFLTQNLNYDLRWQEQISQFPLLTGSTPSEELLLVKVAEYHTSHINFHAMFLAREKPAGKWQAHARTSRQIPLFQNLLTDLATQAGLGDFTFWGDFARTPFAMEQSHDLIVAARKL